MRNRTLIVSSLAAAALALAACSSTDEATTSESAQPSTAAETTSAAAEAVDHSGVHMHDGVVRAMEDGADMTAIFGTIHNGTDKDVTVVGFTTSIDAEMNQIHEVVDGVMQEKEGGLEIPAGGSVELAPGGEHLMMMGVKDKVVAGDEIDVSLLLGDGTTAEMGKLPVRTMAAGEEGYEDMGGMDMSGHDHGDHAESTEGTEAAEHNH